MTFDLRFWRDPDRGPTPRSELLSAFSGREHVELDDDDLLVGAFVYYNPDTEVYFRFELDKPSSRPGERSDESGRLTVPGKESSELVDTGLTLRMNVCRPSYFADEAFPIIHDVTRSLGLLTEDTASKLRARPTPLDEKALARIWRDRNAIACARVRARDGGSDDLDGPLRWAPRESLDGFWRYMSRRRAIQRGAAGDLYAPAIVLVRRREPGAPAASPEPSADLPVEERGPLVRRLVVWKTPDPFLLPEVDLVHLVAPGGAGSDDLVAPRAIVEELLGDRLTAVADAPAPLRRYDGRDRDQVVRKLGALALGDPPSAYRECEADSFFDLSEQELATASGEKTPS